MQYALIEKSGKKIPLELEGFGKPYKALHKQTDTDGYSAFLLESHNNFDNIFARLSQARYDEMEGWGEIFRDVVRDGGKGTDEKGRLHVKYTANAGTPKKKITFVYAPKSGFWVPTDDGIFQPDTLIPFETVSDKRIAIRRLEAKDIPAEQVSYFFRLDNYGSDRFVGRGFGPVVGVGRFFVGACRLPSDSGRGWVASRPKIGGKDNECIMKI